MNWMARTTFWHILVHACVSVEFGILCARVNIITWISVFVSILVLWMVSVLIEIVNIHNQNKGINNI